jgi:hypothetical protein
LTVAGILGIAFGLRLLIGLHTPLDSDEATEAIASLRLLHGQLPMMEPSARYLGALDSYLLAPFLAALGPTLLAVRLAMATVGMLYVGAMAWLGRLVLGPRGGLVLGTVAAAFPLFAITFGIQARAYGSTLLLEALFLALAVRVIWPTRTPPRRDWAACGFVAGLAVWNHPLMAMPVVLSLIALVMRSRAMPAGTLRRGLPTAIAAGLIGFSPWLLYNGVFTHIGSVRHLYSPLQNYSIPTAVAARQVVTDALPIFIGARVNYCGPETVPWPVVDAGLLALAASVVWIRRQGLRELVRGRPQPAELVLAIGPLAILAVTVHWFNVLSCQPRYLMPLAVPLALAAALVLTQPLPWRAVAAVAAAACVVVSTITAVRSAEVSSDLVTVHHIRIDMVAGSRAIVTRHPEAVWAEYSLARPIQFYGGDGLIVGEYGGYVGFPGTQTAAYRAGHPSWLFVAGSPTAGVLEAECAKRGITYARSEPVPGLVLYSNLSARLTPDDLGLGGQRLDHTDPDPPTL